MKVDLSMAVEVDEGSGEQSTVFSYLSGGVVLASRSVPFGGQMHQWVIYWNTTDFPEKYVVRKWQAIPEVKPSDECLVCDDLETARAYVKQLRGGSLVRIPAVDEDDPVVVEVWV